MLCSHSRSSFSNVIRSRSAFTRFAAPLTSLPSLDKPRQSLYGQALRLRSPFACSPLPSVSTAEQADRRWREFSSWPEYTSLWRISAIVLPDSFCAGTEEGRRGGFNAVGHHLQVVLRNPWKLNDWKLLTTLVRPISDRTYRGSRLWAVWECGRL